MPDDWNIQRLPSGARPQHNGPLIVKRPQHARPRRCLKPGGQLIIASTGPRHLLELRKILYEQVDTATLNTDQAVKPYFQPEAKQPQPNHQTFVLEGCDSIMDLLAMTPHYWRASLERKQQLKQLSRLSLSLDIQLNCYQNKTKLES